MGTFHEPIECKIGELFLENRLVIPAYQRPYSWSVDQIEDLWFDMRECIKTEQNHYIGPMYFTTTGVPKAPLEVTDGQQRITSFQLFFLAMLRVIENKLSTYQDSEFQKKYLELHARLLNLNRRNGKLILELGSSDKDAYKKLTDNYSEVPVELDKWKDDFDNSLVFLKSAEMLHRNFTYFADKLEKMVLDHIPEIDDEVEITENTIQRIRKGYIAAVDSLSNALNIVLDKFIFIQLIIDDKSDLKSFKLFETINDRGKPLDQVDKIKNYLFKNIYRMVILFNNDQSFSSAYEDIKKKWSSLQSLLDNDLEDFIRYYLNQDTKIGSFIKQKELYEKIVDYIEKSDIITENSNSEDIRKYYLSLFDKSKKLVEELDKNKSFYYSIIEPGKQTNLSDVTKANLKIVKSYGIVRSLVLKILIQFRSDPKTLEKLIIITTNAAILYVSVYNLKKLESIERKIYDHFTKKIKITDFYESYGQHLKDVIHLTNSEFNLDSDVMKKNISSCSNDAVNYNILIKLNDYLNHKRSSDFYHTLVFANKTNGLTRDHILPTNYDAEYRMKIVDYFVQKGLPVPKSKHIREAYLNSIGNIMPLKIDPNRSKTNRNDPLVFYREEMTVKGELVQDLLKYTTDEWLLDDIQKRSERLAELIVEKKVLSLDFNEVLY